jgi:glycosyltransferase involved in cell wall biosynthesis
MIRSISILIPTHNRAELLGQTLDSLGQVRIPTSIETDLVVVANVCTDSTVDVCRAALPRMSMSARCVEETQLGLSAARNRAVAESRGEICAFLDDDVSISPGWLEGMLEVFHGYPADIVGGQILLWWSAVERPDWLDPQLESFLGLLDYGDEVVELFHPKRRIGGGNFAFKRQLFDTIGPFRTDLGRIGRAMIATEETEFCQRALSQGARMFYAPRMSLKHWVAVERATIEFLVSAARGSTKGRMRAKNPFGPRQFARSFFGNSYLTARYEMSRWAAKLRRDRMREVTSYVMRTSSAAGAAECLRRAFSLGR